MAQYFDNKDEITMYELLIVTSVTFSVRKDEIIYVIVYTLYFIKMTRQQRIQIELLLACETNP